MPGPGGSESPAVRTTGTIVGVTAVVGYLVLGWPYSGSEGLIPTVLGIIGGVGASVWTLYSRIYQDEGP